VKITGNFVKIVRGDGAGDRRLNHADRRDPDACRYRQGPAYAFEML